MNACGSPRRSKMMRHQPGAEAAARTQGKPKQTQITTAAEHKRVVKMDRTIAISALAQRWDSRPPTCSEDLGARAAQPDD